MKIIKILVAGILLLLRFAAFTQNIPCNNWLKFPSQGTADNVAIGDLDVSGNKITVEAVFNASFVQSQNIISKHFGPSDVNYLLRPYHAQITTTNGFFNAEITCSYEANKIYHVAMVYDGNTLKYYRNGFLMTSVPASGNLITNDWVTRIGNKATLDILEPFTGHINEVRIWNVARTQAQIQANIFSTLPNPTTQPGLLGYYTFDNLLNKQGNAVYNGVLNGGATINNTVPNCNYVADSCVIPQVPCNNWLKFPNQGTADNVAIGDLDVSGNKITVEALYSASFVQSQNLISKHFGPADVNYLLRPYHAQITTTNGFFNAEISCSYEANKIYHAAMVYDGSTLKYYRNGFLMTSVPASGNLITNNWVTRIGNKATLDILEPFTGHINEVRIWNTARTQTQIQSNMFTSLANPTTQTGLLAYYTFDNLLNKQGNATYNGVLNGGTTINNTVPNCNYVADSCVIPQVQCNNWLKFPNQGTADNVAIGDLDVSGNKITVEALYSASFVQSQNIISKHFGPADVNYLLRPYHAQITTTNGFFNAEVTCPYEANKIYHSAMVYDGTSLKYYRNGFLMVSVPASGNLITNDWIARIGNKATLDILEPFTGHINEVRIWNVARTQAQIQANMFTSLSNPTTQAGLLAYYTFDNLLNKQGNPAWNGTINGAASINNTVPNCIYVADNNGFAVDAGSDTSYCTSTSIARQLQATAGATTYSWSPAAFLNNPNIANPIATISTTTKFYVTATAANGCSGTDSVTISIGNGATIQTLADTPICKNAPLQLTATAGFSAYHWSPGIYVSDSTIANPLFMGTQNQQLIITGITTNGCTAKDTVNITIKPLPLPIIKTIEDTLICNTNSITLNTTGATAYSWWPINNLSNPNIGNPIFNGSTDATYYVKGFNADGCYNFDTINIYVNTLTPFIPPPNKQMCEQQTVQLDGNNGTRVSYNWTPIIYLSNNQIINPIAFPPVTTPYNVIINDKACNHTESFIVTVFVLPKPQIVATKLNDIDCAQKTAHLEATGAVSYIWSPSNGLSNINASNPIASIPQKYYVTGTTLNGCFNKDSVIVLDNKAISLGRFMPNAFTPNGDNINDCYRLKNWLHLETLQFSIFNRWGDRVFFTTNINKCWDGTFKGKKADAGNYTYMIKAKTKCGLEEQKGNILLIR